jgi:hypothetical protein
MQGIQNDYLAAYRSLKLTRDSEGVLVVEFHSNDGCGSSKISSVSRIDKFSRL